MFSNNIWVENLCVPTTFGYVVYVNINNEAETKNHLIPTSGKEHIHFLIQVLISMALLLTNLFHRQIF